MQKCIFVVGLTLALIAGAASAHAEKEEMTYRANAQDIDMERIKMIESSGDPTAFNKKSGARGLYQITPICLREWNSNHWREQYTLDDLFDPEINYRIANWYMNIKIPFYLRVYGIEDIPENRVIAYNWGIGNLRKYIRGRKTLPKETKNYLLKYNEGR